MVQIPSHKQRTGQYKPYKALHECLEKKVGKLFNLSITRPDLPMLTAVSQYAHAFRICFLQVVKSILRF